MYKVLVFAGTTEGYELCRFLGRTEGFCTAPCVATEYGTRSPGELPGVALHAGRMDESQMEAFIQETSPELVLDATHPYAAEVTKNIREACDNKSTEYVADPAGKGKTCRIRQFMQKAFRRCCGIFKRHQGKYSSYYRKQGAFSIYRTSGL